MPQMGYDMQEGTVVRWLASEGDEVKAGEAVAEIETDKAVVEFESTESGVLRRILEPEGATVPVGQAIAIVGTADEELPEPTESAPEPEAEAEPAKSASIPLPPPPAQAEEAPAPTQEVRASPVARRLAEEKGIDLSQITGSGPGDRITRDDVLAFEAAAPERRERAAPEAAPAAGAPPAPAEAAPCDTR